jgi:Cu(I)/Ag(I) efflux system membrane fusion protein
MFKKQVKMKKVFFLAAVLVLMTASSACSSKKQNQEEVTQAVTAEVSHAALTVQGACEMCKERIENAAKSVEGVTDAAWNQETKELHLDFDAAKTSVETVSQALAKAGHDTEKDKADEDVYNALPPCCKYRG